MLSNRKELNNRESNVLLSIINRYIYKHNKCLELIDFYIENNNKFVVNFKTPNNYGGGIWQVCIKRYDGELTTSFIEKSLNSIGGYDEFNDVC